MYKFFVPADITADYKYLVPSADYYDLYNVDYLQPNQTYLYYRFYYNLDEDLFSTRAITTTNYNYGTLNYIEIEPTQNYLYRRDYPEILFTSSIFIIFIVILINLMTSIIKKRGVLSELF